MQRYDVAIIGSGPEGLVAAIVLARGGASVLVLERKSGIGGRAATLEFHPGFRASPYADELGAMPARLYDALALARAGAFLIPAPASVCVSDAGTTVLYGDAKRRALEAPREARDALFAHAAEIGQRWEASAVRAREIALPAHPHPLAFWKRPAPSAPWPDAGWQSASLEEHLRARFADPALRLHLIAEAIAGRAVSPLLGGTALHLLGQRGRSGLVPGGLKTLSAALAASAQGVGAAIRTDAPVTEIAIAEHRARKLVLAGGEEVEARAVLSTLDVKATFQGVIRWSELDAGALKRLLQFRIAGQAARVLVALNRMPELALPREHPDAARGAIHVAGSVEGLSRAYNAWRSGVLDEAPPVTLRFPSLTDPRLAPVGGAVLTATIGCIPARLFDGEWTAAKRERLAAMALQAAARVAPGIVQHVVGLKILAGPDIENELGLTAGDLDGGEVAPDQMFGFRPFGNDPAWADGRTPVGGLYLAGPSAAPGPFFLGLSGERAGQTILADMKAGRLP